MPDLVLDYHRRKVPVDHLDRSVTREKLEYATEYASFAYLSCINAILVITTGNHSYGIISREVFTDKAVFQMALALDIAHSLGRVQNRFNYYIHEVSAEWATSDHRLWRYLNGSWTLLASEAVNVEYEGQGMNLSITGSELKGSRWDYNTPLDPLDLPTPSYTIVATDTTFASGYFGVRPLAPYSYQGGTSSSASYLLPPATPIPNAEAVIEVEVQSEGSREDPYTAKLMASLAEIRSDLNVPGFLIQEKKRYDILRAKGFTDEEMRLLLGYVPEHQVDLDAVSWGAFEFSEKSPTNVIVVYGDNPYKPGAIERQKEFIKSKGLRVFKPPRDFKESIEQYISLKRDFPHWIAGKDSYAYQTLGHEVFDLFQNVDFYYGELIEHKTHYDQLKQVQDWEIMRRFESLEKELSKVTVLTEERDKHLKKLREVEKLGW